MSTVDNTRPPYVAFERRAVEDRSASIAAGHYVSKDVDIAIITRPGSRDNLEKDALTWLAEIREKGRKDEIPRSWYEGFSASYKSWKDGEEAPVSGTPIKGWPVLSPAAQKDLIHAGIRTVEDLANLPDGDVGMIGTGAIAYKQKAVAWLAAANGTGKVVEQISALTTQVKELTDLSKRLVEENALLKAQLPKPATVKG